ncbi:biotin synthase BioB [Oleidesulfovibrio alaskensis]|jgi:biotin synthase|uniref:biotin synthase BioB n=1 Tax=Oleidesulfovibrio alaskensis TaxID=58180 RepID=UPI001A4FF168|nr:biotin synthase BioB [Oleidesulfovibrio alaskensis]MBL3582164.1 biotin synthase BioB [Oleidesulfovibrio alaskensis]
MTINPDDLCRRIMADPEACATEDEALRLLELPAEQTLPLIACAQRIRTAHAGPAFTCAIVNARSGRCPENCSFCAQSAHYATGAPEHPMLNTAALVEHALKLADAGADRFGIVTSGTRPAPRELETVCEAVVRIRARTHLSPCASLGQLSPQAAAMLRQAGLERYHHNLETARSFFASVCTTHDYDEDIYTVKLAREAGLAVCCGGILGLGESRAQRAELSGQIKRCRADSVPVNLLTPVAGTPLERMDPLPPFEALRTIAVFRFMHPRADILVAGGREHVLGEYRSWTFISGANGLMVGNYLTTAGRSTADDYTMLRHMGVLR